MDEANKKFVQDIVEKMQQVKHLHDANIKINKTKESLGEGVGKLIDFINKDVIGANTSSLIRTDVDLTQFDYREWHKSNADASTPKFKYMLTVNHLGFGKLEVSDRPDSYCSTTSKELQHEEFVKYILDKNIQMKLLVFLAKNNNKKMLAICTEVFSKIDILQGMSEIADKYRYDKRLGLMLEEDFSEDIDIAVPAMRDDDYEVMATVKNLTIRKVVIKEPNNVFLIGAGVTEGDMEKLGDYSFHAGRDLSVPFTSLDFTEMRGAMIGIQLVDDLSKAFAAVQARLDVDAIKCKDVEDKINLEFAIYRMAKELKTTTK